MAHIQVELDAMKKVPPAARLAGTTEGAFGWGLVTLWQWCWVEKTEHVEADQLVGFFGSEEAARALVAFGFVEPAGAPSQRTFRVCGAEKYLRITRARAAGAAKTNAKRATVERRSSVAPATQTDALSPNTDHRTPRQLPAAGEPPKSAAAEIDRRAASGMAESGGSRTGKNPASNPPSEPAEIAGGVDFAAWAQAMRIETFPQALMEYPSRAKFDAWFPEAMAALGGNRERLNGAWLAYLRDEWAIARKPPCPWALWFTTWAKHVPGQRAQGAETARAASAACEVCGGSDGCVAPTWGHPLCSGCNHRWEADVLGSADPLVHADLQGATDSWVAQWRTGGTKP